MLRAQRGRVAASSIDCAAPCAMYGIMGWQASPRRAYLPAWMHPTASAGSSSSASFPLQILTRQTAELAQPVCTSSFENRSMSSVIVSLLLPFVLPNRPRPDLWRAVISMMILYNSPPAQGVAKPACPLRDPSSAWPRASVTRMPASLDPRGGVLAGNGECGTQTSPVSLGSIAAPFYGCTNGRLDAFGGYHPSPPGVTSRPAPVFHCRVYRSRIRTTFAFSLDRDIPVSPRCL